MYFFRYVAGFLWIDKLGQAALNNYQIIIRQTFYHGCYALLGEDLLPNPDFWFSVMYKRIVSTKVGHFPFDRIKTTCLKIFFKDIQGGDVKLAQYSEF